MECRSKVNLEFEHVIPFSKGGTNSVENIINFRF
ncbi:MAG: HNH endonuclease [Promethearchaeia archaeon]